MEIPSREICDRARISRDPRFDGRFFTGVLTTRIYCRPVCPVRPARSENVEFFPSAAAAAESGYRPCLRCRPETAPGTPAWRGTSSTVSRGMRLLAAGALDHGSVEELAEKLGVGTRHLTRLFVQHLGASPLAIAQTRRLHFAKRLIDDTTLSITQVAFSAGYRSVRRFNSAIRAAYGISPSRLRSAALKRKSRQQIAFEAGFDCVLRLPYRPPLDWESQLATFERRAVPGVEEVRGGRYCRTVQHEGNLGSVEIAPCEGRDAIEVRIDLRDPIAFLPIVGRVRRVFDLAADPMEVETHLAGDATLADLVNRAPGLRIAGSWSGFEALLHAVAVEDAGADGATALLGRLARETGKPVSSFRTPALSRIFPTPEAIAARAPESLDLPSELGRRVHEIARLVAEGRFDFSAWTSPDVLAQELEQCLRMDGSAARYVVMRSLDAPDAFPPADATLLRAW